MAAVVSRTAAALLLAAGCTAAPDVRPCTPLDATRSQSAFVVAWGKVHAGEPLDDTDLQALSDAHDVLECHAGEK